MTLPYASYKFVSFNDFDGTITTQDSNDYMTDNLGMGEAARRQYSNDILNGKIGFRDAFAAEIASVSDKGHTFESCKELVKKNIKLDPGFKEYFDWCKEHDVPVVIVSSGMTPIIRSILSNLLGDEDAARIEIISNDVDVKEDGKFSVTFRHPESPFGHDKSKALRPYRELPEGQRPVIFFCGDGVSDMSAAGESDVLFVKVIPGGNNDLYDYCKKRNIPFIPYIDFVQVKEIVKGVVEGKITVEDINAGKVTIAEVEKALQDAANKV